ANSLIVVALVMRTSNDRRTSPAGSRGGGPLTLRWRRERVHPSRRAQPFSRVGRGEEPRPAWANWLKSRFAPCTETGHSPKRSPSGRVLRYPESAFRQMCRHDAKVAPM